MERQNILRLVKNMTLEEKAGMCSGRDFWYTKAVARLGVPAIRMTDGPHGIRMVSADKGMEESRPATCFPTASALGCTWDSELAGEIGRAIGREALALGIHLVLGPGINIKRSPLCGRNFEYFSEDPRLTAHMAAGLARGIQSTGAGACVKHFAVNNQETDRMRVNAIVDEQTLSEIYLSAFEQVVKQVQPVAVMAAYNRINGEYATQHKELLTDRLLKEWGFKGMVISDWAAVYDRVSALNAGLHLQMPGDGGVSDEQIAAAVQRGIIKEAHLDEMVIRILEIVFRLHEGVQRPVQVDFDAHHALARRAAAESIVLLKNEENVLPIVGGTYKKVLVVGGFAQKPRFQGGGSSQINPTRVDVPFEEIKKAAGGAFEILYAQGYSPEDNVDEDLIREACAMAKNADMVIVMAGLPDLYESEGYDRRHIDMPASHNRLISELAKVHSRVAVVLQNGSGVSMPWLDDVEAVLETWLGGQAVGGAVADVLFGKVNPCAKLAVSLARRLEDTPAYLNWPGRGGTVRYGEGVFVGYRYYEKKKISPLFPFGHGLSYTKFEYAALRLGSTVWKADRPLEVGCSLTNSGARAGKEVVQLYLGWKTPPAHQPLKWLAASRKIGLEPGESKEIRFSLTADMFARFDPDRHKRLVKNGEYALFIGSSSRDIRLNAVLEIDAQQEDPLPLSKYSTLAEWQNHPKGREQVEPLVAAMLSILGIEEGAEVKPEQRTLVEKMAADVPVCKMIQFSAGKISEQMIEEMIKKTE